MVFISVNSSNIDCIAYENSVLAVQFRNGHEYHYFGVPEFVYRSLMLADSHGRYFSSHIKNVYRYERVS